MVGLVLEYSISVVTPISGYFEQGTTSRVLGAGPCVMCVYLVRNVYFLDRFQGAYFAPKLKGSLPHNYISARL